MTQKIWFTKMHGCGNDYIYINTMQYPIADPSAAAVAWSDRHKGIGSDGLVLIGKSPIPEADFSMRIFNADGSEAMMCGNASRCIGKYLYETGKTEIRLLTRSGVKTLLLHVIDHQVECVTVDMGIPTFEVPEQFAASKDPGLGTFVSMGNPHYVIFTDDVDQVAETGHTLECHPAFPQRCNIEFVTPLSSPEGDINTLKDKEASPRGGLEGVASRGGLEGVASQVGLERVFRTRVWERGSGITQACGTGACATAVAACLKGLAGRDSDIQMDGGTLHISWSESNHETEGALYLKDHVYMTGPTTFVFDGEIETP